MRIIVLFLGICLSSFAQTPDQILVFTKTGGFRHKSIDVGVNALKQLGSENNFEITHTEDSKIFNTLQLQQFKVVVFLNTTGDILNSEQEQAFKTFINNGGSFVGIHAASDTEFDWPWYGKLVGAYFLSHPEQSEATIVKTEVSHPAINHLSATWTHYDEWYNFKSISEDIQELLMLDESSYNGGENGAYHPIAWYQEYDGGRSFYTGLGHTVASYSDPAFKEHILGGILYCLNR